MYPDHRKGPRGPLGGATYPGGPHGLKWEGNQPLVGWCAPPWASPAPRVGNPRGGGAPHLAWGGSHPLAGAPLGDCISQGRRPPRRPIYRRGEGGQPHHSPWRLPLPLAELGEALPRSPLLPPPRRRAAGTPSTSPSPLLDQEGGDVFPNRSCVERVGAVRSALGHR